MISDWFAISELDSAIDRTRDLLWPFKIGVWLRLAVISFFVGGSTGFNPFGYQFSGQDLPSWYPGEIPPDILDTVAANIPLFLIALVGIILLLIIILGIIGSIFQFVFVDCLSSRDVSLSRTFNIRTGKGVRLFLFQLGLVLLLIIILGLLALVFFGPLILGLASENGFAIASAILFIPVLVMLILIFALVQLLTIDFVVPVMIRDDSGVISGWKTVYSFLRAEWKQPLVYVVVKFVLSIATGILLVILGLIALLVVGVPFALLAILLMLFLEAGATILILIIPFAIIAILVVLMISVPFTTFFRHYSLLVLERIAPDYALLPQPSAEAT
jgi:hypothetical protein